MSMQKIIMYWRDIPSMVTIKERRERGKTMLPNRFQHAIDRAAMRAGKGDGDLYIEEWRREVSEIEQQGSLQEMADREAAALAESISEDLLKQMAKNHGYMPGDD